MKNKEVDNKVKTAFESVTPDGMENIREQISSAQQVAAPVTVGGGRKRVRWFKRVALGAACVAAFVIGGLGIYGYNMNYATATEISFDVNPSITMEVNGKGRVKDVKANNADAERVIAGLDFNGSTYEVAVKAVIGSMLTTGYLSDISNSVLVSVNDGKSDRGKDIEQAIFAEIEHIFTDKQFDGAVICQSIGKNADLQSLANEYGITMGKANLIQKIVNAAKDTGATATESAYNVKDLAGLTINELNVLAKSFSVNLGESVLGTASTQGYKAKDFIREKALEFANIDVSKINGKIEAEFDFENGLIVYEVSFKSGDFEFEVKVNATSGELVAISEERETGLGKMGIELSSEDLLDVAKVKAGLEVNAEVTDLETDKDDDEYEVEFTFGGFRYEVELRVDGEVKSYKKKLLFAKNGAGATITEERAKEIAIEKANELAKKFNVQLDENVINNIKVETSEDDGVLSYEVEFKLGFLAEFEVRINATSGAIIKADVDFDIDLPGFDNNDDNDDNDDDDD